MAIVTVAAKGGKQAVVKAVFDQGMVAAGFIRWHAGGAAAGR